MGKRGRGIHRPRDLLGMETVQGRVVAGIPVWNEDAHTIAPALASCRPLYASFRFVGDLSRFHTHANIRRYALNKARYEFNAQWLVQMDADERLINGERLVEYLQTYPGFAFPVPLVQETGEVALAPFRVIRTDNEIESRCEYIRRGHKVWALTGYAHMGLDDVPLDEPYVYHCPSVRKPERRMEERLSVIEMETDPPVVDAEIYYPPPIGGILDAEETTLNDEGEVVSDAKYYCPGCGQRYDTPGLCSGTAEAGHEPLSVEKVSGKKDKAETEAGTDDNDTALPNTHAELDKIAAERGVTYPDGTKTVADKKKVLNG